MLSLISTLHSPFRMMAIRWWLVFVWFRLCASILAKKTPKRNPADHTKLFNYYFNHNIFCVHAVMHAGKRYAPNFCPHWKLDFESNKILIWVHIHMSEENHCTARWPDANIRSWKINEIFICRLPANSDSRMSREEYEGMCRKKERRANPWRRVEFFFYFLTTKEKSNKIREAKYLIVWRYFSRTEKSKRYFVM